MFSSTSLATGRNSTSVFGVSTLLVLSGILIPSCSNAGQRSSSFCKFSHALKSSSAKVSDQIINVFTPTHPSSVTEVRFLTCTSAFSSETHLLKFTTSKLSDCNSTKRNDAHRDRSSRCNDTQLVVGEHTNLVSFLDPRNSIFVKPGGDSVTTSSGKASTRDGVCVMQISVAFTRMRSRNAPQVGQSSASGSASAGRSHTPLSTARSHPGSCRGSTAAFAIFAGALSFAITNPHALASPRAPGRV
mmetsp:Transcript_4184/g.13962  ORF Transcript_4184/g.13962 Transcript_4184/m.13962 type:complete len:245 (+) Transcript_4184:682-1416(+)